MALEAWHWWTLGGALVVLEAVAPGFVLIWLGLAALLTGSLVWLAPGLAWPWQVTAFSLATVALVAGWLAWRRRHPPVTDEATLNRRAESYVGELVTLVEPIVDGRGKVRVGDTVWLARGPDLPAGRRVRVVAARGTQLEVEPAPDHP